MFILLIIGLLHAYLLWAGDILVPYALCGILLWWMRNRSARTLLYAAILMLAIGAAMGAAHGLTWDSMSEADRAAELEGRLSSSTYARVALVATPVGLGLAFVGALELDRVAYAMPIRALVDLSNYAGAVFASIGYAATLIWIVKRQAMAGLRRRLLPLDRWHSPIACFTALPLPSCSSAGALDSPAASTTPRSCSSSSRSGSCS
jgi:uncharacterized membrane protein YeiB